MKYLCIAYEEQRKLDELSKSEWQALRQETIDYVESLRKQGRLIITHALQSATAASTVRVRSGKEQRACFTSPTMPSSSPIIPTYPPACRPRAYMRRGLPLLRSESSATCFFGAASGLPDQA